MQDEDRGGESDRVDGTIRVPIPIFDDLHDTGIYSWRYFHELGRDHGSRWERYLADLAAKGMSREP